MSFGYQGSPDGGDPNDYHDDNVNAGNEQIGYGDNDYDAGINQQDNDIQFYENNPDDNAQMDENVHNFDPQDIDNYDQPPAYAEEDRVREFDPNENLNADPDQGDDYPMEADDPNALGDEYPMVVDEPNAFEDENPMVIDDPNALGDEYPMVDDQNAFEDENPMVTDDPNALGDEYPMVVDEPNAFEDENLEVIDDPNTIDNIESNEPAHSPSPYASQHKFNRSVDKSPSTSPVSTLVVPVNDVQDDSDQQPQEIQFHEDPVSNMNTSPHLNPVEPIDSNRMVSIQMPEAPAAPAAPAAPVVPRPDPPEKRLVGERVDTNTEERRFGNYQYKQYEDPLPPLPREMCKPIIDPPTVSMKDLASKIRGIQTAQDPKPIIGNPKPPVGPKKPADDQDSKNKWFKGLPNILMLIMIVFSVIAVIIFLVCFILGLNGKLIS